MKFSIIMLDKKYIIAFVIIVSLLVIYYFYSEINAMKKLILPTYKKSMALEVRINNLEKVSNEMIIANSRTKKSRHEKPLTETDIMSITYKSDVQKSDNNTDVRYTELSENSAKKLIANLSKNRSSPKSPSKSPQKSDDVVIEYKIPVKQSVKSDDKSISELDNILSALEEDIAPGPANSQNNCTQQLNNDSDKLLSEDSITDLDFRKSATKNTIVIN